MPEDNGKTSLAPRVWYALLTQPRHEKKVLERLLAFGLEAYLPLRREIHRWADRNKLVVIPVLPGYVFLRSDSAGLRRAAQACSGLVDPLGRYGKAQVVSDEDLGAVRRLSLSEVPLRLCPDEAAEDAGVLTEGVLAGLHGSRRADGSYLVVLRSLRLAIAVDLKD